MIHLDETRQKEAIEAGWEAYSEQIPTWRHVYDQVATEWKPVAVCDDEKVIGVLFCKHHFIHLGIIKEYRGKWASRRIIHDMLIYGNKTELMPGQDPDFVERIGFRKEGATWLF